MAAKANEPKSVHRNISIHISDRSHVNLTLNMYNCGNQDFVAEHRTKTDYYIFYFVKEGKGYVTQRQAIHRVEAGQGFVAYPNEEVSIKPEYKSKLNASWVAFSGYLVERYLFRAKITAYEPLFFDTGAGELRKMFDDLLEASMHMPNRYCKLMSQLYSMFGFLLDHSMGESRLETATPEMYLVKALDFIDINYHADISVEDIASSAGTNRKALYATFKSLTGFSPRDYLIYYRMCKATALLKDSNLSIETVAVSVGYHDQFHFSKEFKKNVGVSPSEYRKNIALDPNMEFQSPIDSVRKQFPAAVLEIPPKF